MLLTHVTTVTDKMLANNSVTISETLNVAHPLNYLY